jgi:hypothetical protein
MQSKDEIIQEILRVLQNIEASELPDELKAEAYRMTSQFIHLLFGNILGGLGDSVIELQEMIDRQLHENLERIYQKQRINESNDDDDDPGETVH